VLAASGAGFGPFPSHGVTGGNQRIALAFARHLRVELGAPVERVSWSDEGVRIRAAGTETEADACVIAVPAYAGLEFDPPLPERKQRALAAVRYGDAAKLFLPLAEPAEPSAVLSIPGRFWAYTQHGPDGSPLPVLAAFAGTRGAVESLTPNAVRELRRELVFADAEPVVATWPDGAYSARAIESPLDDEALAEPVGPLAFAGEHTAGAWHALMDGALRSGIRAADDLRS
jgi:predicted NAD/FAD-dependent oxidoreductase